MHVEFLFSCNLPVRPIRPTTPNPLADAVNAPNRHGMCPAKKRNYVNNENQYPVNMKSRRIIQLVILLAAAAFLHSQLAQAQVRTGGAAPAGSPPVGVRPAGMQPMGVAPAEAPSVGVPPAGNPPGGLPLPATPPALVPPAGTPPVGVPSEGTPIMGVAPAGTPLPGGNVTPLNLGAPPTLNTPQNNAMRPMTNHPFSRPPGANGFGPRGGRRDGDGDADDMRRRQPNGFDRRFNRNGTNGAPAAGPTGASGEGTSSQPATPQGVPAAPR